MGKSRTRGRGAGRRVFGYIKTSSDVQRTRCVTEKNHVAHPRSRIKKYPERTIRNPPFESESEESEENGAQEKIETIARKKISRFHRRSLRDSRGGVRATRQTQHLAFRILRCCVA